MPAASEFNDGLLITSTPYQLTEGLFGGIFLHIFEILPALDRLGVTPTWKICSNKYGSPADDFTIIPGLLETTVPVSNLPKHEINLTDVRQKYAVTLGNDWAYSSRIWNRYFRWPARVIQRADGFPPLGDALALHYRGTDKNTDLIQTNPVTAENFLRLVRDFVEKHPDIKSIFVASDENTFAEKVKTAHPSLQIITTGDVAFWQSGMGQDNIAKGDHAMLDCILLSRCKYLIKCQSALSGFAKVLNPKIQAYRVSANKLTNMPWGIHFPYFPDAYLPKLTSEDPQCQQLLAAMLAGDWTENATAMKRYRGTFKYKTRKGYQRSERPIGKYEWNRVHRWLDTNLHRMMSNL